MHVDPVYQMFVVYFIVLFNLFFCFFCFFFSTFVHAFVFIVCKLKSRLLFVYAIYLYIIKYYIEWITNISNRFK